MAGTYTRIINGMLRTVQIDQSVTLTAGLTTKTVTFPGSLQGGSTTPNVVAFLINTTDANPQFIPVTVTARSATQFTASWNFPTDTANYILAYHVPDGWLA